MNIIVQKFGGTSVGDPERIKNVAKRIIETKESGKQVVAVVSAMGKSTDTLLALANAITDNPANREMDMLLATGEQVSISLLSMAIKERGYNVVSLTGAQAGIFTNEEHKKAKITHIDTAKIMKELSRGTIVIVAGFQGRTLEGEITTLGRGGSDTTAVAIAASLKAEICEIFTDVDGVYTTDPRLVEDAKKLDVVSYDEMLELASLGALVLQNRAVEFGKKFGVKIAVRSSFNHNEGTIIEEDNLMEKARLVSGVTYDNDVVKITLVKVPDRPGVAGTIFKNLANNSINVDMIVQSNPHGKYNDISFTSTAEDGKKAYNLLVDSKSTLNYEELKLREDLSKVSIVGAGMQSNPGVAADMFEALADNNINIELISTSEIKVSCLINRADAKKSIKIIHNKFHLEEL